MINNLWDIMSIIQEQNQQWKNNLIEKVNQKDY